MNTKEQKTNAYKRAIENADVTKINKILKGLETGKITKENFWDSIRKLTKSVSSDHSMNRWEILSEWFYNQLISIHASRGGSDISA